MPITLNHSNIGVQYNTGSNYIIETVKSDLYRRNEIYNTIVSNNIQTAPVTPVVYIENTSNVYAVESYTYSGTANTADYTRVFTKNTVCDILVVGGGGGGGKRSGGGGGAGTLLYHKNITLNGTYNIKVGKGGAGQPSNETPTSSLVGAPEDGGFSQFIKSDGAQNYYAIGGGRGTGGKGTPNPPPYVYANTNGGQGYLYDANLTLSSGNIFNGVAVAVSNKEYVNTLTLPEGCRGRIGGIQINNYKGGGGGGAGGVGMNHAEETTVNDGYGGLGLAIDITGTSVVYAGGGSGSDFSGSVSQVFDPAYPTIESRGGGGYGSDNGTPQNGLAGTGGGGGAQGNDTNGNPSGSGGSGIVIIRYLLGTVPSTNLLSTEPTINPSVLVADAYYPRVPATNSATWIDNGYTVNVKVSDPVLSGTQFVYYLFNNIITTDDHYHSTAIYANNGNTTYSGATSFKGNSGIAISIDIGRNIYPKRTRIAPRANHPQYGSQLTSAPGTFKIYASNNPSSWNDNNHIDWVLIHSQTSAATFVNSQYTIISLSNTPSISYRYYTMVVMTLAGNYAYLAFSEWSIGGDEKMVFELDGVGGTHKKLVFDYPKQGAISEMTGMNNWVKIKHKPASWTTVYSGNTFNGSSISGTYTLNNSNDNSKEWAVAFTEPDVKYYLFVMHMSQLNPNFKDLWMVFEPSEMKKASTYSGTYAYHVNYPHAYKTTMKPLGFAAKNSTYYQGPGYDQVNIYNRVDAGPLGGADPYISMYNINNNMTWSTIDGIVLYGEHNIGYNLPAVEGGVYVKYDNDVSFGYPPNSSYTLNFPVPTLTDINNHSNIILRGTYNINVNNSNILITPKPPTFINTITNYNIERMYPPVRNFTAATTTVSGQVYGNGTYVVSYSSFLTSYEPFKCFNTSDTIGGHWPEATYTDGNYPGSAFIVAGYLGEWLKIQLPVAIKLTRFGFLMRTTNTDRSPKDFKIYGSNDNITWVELVNKTGAVYNASNMYEQTTPEITNSYNYYGLVVNKLFSGATVLNFDEWYIYGQEVLPSSLSIRYNLLNPTLDPVGAQWTYNSSNTNVYHMGSVGIGTMSPEYQLDVRGFIFASGGGYTQTGSENWVVQSDRRIKENIVKASYEKCLENVKNIELYNFNFKDNCVNTNDRNQLGFIAQEVQQVYPKAVEVGKIILDNNQGINDLLTLNTTQIKYTLYGAVKNLIERVENIELRVEQIYNMTLSSNFKSPSSNISISIINTSNMRANTSNIATNTSNISVSTSNIATNTSNIRKNF
jgi:hypothetical protein